MQHLARLSETELTAALQSNKVVLLLGGRQVGKTTLVRKVLSTTGTRYLNLDLAVDKATLLSAANMVPSEAMKLLSAPQAVVIDEAQLLPEVGRIVKGWYDAGLPQHFILLGSSSLNLLNSAAEPLTGRNVKIELFPLLFAEWLPSTGWFGPGLTPESVSRHFAGQLESSLWQRIIYGSYPEAIISDDPEAYLHNLLGDYALRDLVTTDLVRSTDTVMRLLTLLAYLTGSETSVNELAATLGASRQTITRYLDLLERSYVIFKLSPYAGKLKAELGRKPKYYFWDTGLRNAVLKDFTVSPSRGDAAALWENWAVSELMKHNARSGYAWKVGYWKSHAGASVGFVAERNGRTSAYDTSLTARGWKPPKAFTDGYATLPTLLTPADPFAAIL